MLEGLHSYSHHINVIQHFAGFSQECEVKLGIVFEFITKNDKYTILKMCAGLKSVFTLKREKLVKGNT